MEASQSFSMHSSSSPAHRPHGRAPGRELGLFSRLFARRYFDAVAFSDDVAKRLATLSAHGEVVHIMRSVGVLPFFYLAYFLIRAGLPPLRAAIGLRFSFWRPFRRLFRRGSPAHRLKRALDENFSALVFLREPTGLLPGPKPGDNPFFALIARARTATRPIYLVPELFIWQARPRNVRPNIRDLVFGNPERPGKIITAWSFLLNYRTAFFRAGEPIELTAFVRNNATDSDAVLVRKVRGSLLHHLARETRAIVGPPLKTPKRIMEETLRDRNLRNSLESIAQQQSIPLKTAHKQAQRDLIQIANRYAPIMVAIFRSFIGFMVARLYNGIHLEEKDINRLLEWKRKTPLIFCPSHKSHLDSGIMGWVLANRGIVPPLVFAGANLSFWPLGWFLRRASAFFGKRSFKGDPVYAATFKAYLKKLIREGYSLEFFIEGGRSRTGKLLSPKLGMLSFIVNSYIEGAQKDLTFIPVSIDYEKLIEAQSYAREIAGEEKKPESLKSLLSAPKIFFGPRFGKIYISFGEPIFLKEFLEQQKTEENLPDDEEKRQAVASLAQTIAHRIGQSATITPVSLLSTALLADRQGQINSADINFYMQYLYSTSQKEGLRISPLLNGLTGNIVDYCPIQEVIQRFSKDGIIQIRADYKGFKDTSYLIPDSKRPVLCLYKNNLVLFFVTRSLAAFSLLSLGEKGDWESAKERFEFLAHLFKNEFPLPSKVHIQSTLEHAFERFQQEGLITISNNQWFISPDANARRILVFLRDLTRELVEGYRILTASLTKATCPVDRKHLVASAMELGKSELLACIVLCPESLSRPTLDNAVSFYLEQGVLREAGDKKVLLAEQFRTPENLARLFSSIDQFLTPGKSDF